MRELTTLDGSGVRAGSAAVRAATTSGASAGPQARQAIGTPVAVERHRGRGVPELRLDGVHLGARRIDSLLPGACTRSA